MVSPNKRIEVEIPSDEIPGTTQRVVISMPLKRPLADKDDNSPKSKRHGFQYMSLAAKKALCEYKRDRPKASQNELRAFLEREFGVQKVPGSTMSSILANAGKYLSLDDSQATTGRLKLRPGNNQKMEEVLYSWYKKAVAEKVPITDAQIVAVARKIGERLKVPENFAYSYNWLSGFKIRMGIVSKANVTGRKIKSKVVGSKRLSSSGTCSPTTPSASIGNPSSQPVIDILPNIKIEPVECDFYSSGGDAIAMVPKLQLQMYSPSSYDEDSKTDTSDFYRNYVNTAAQDEDDEDGTDFGLDMDCESAEHVQSQDTDLTSGSGMAQNPLFLPNVISKMVRNTIENILPHKTTLESQQSEQTSFKYPQTRTQCKYVYCQRNDCIPCSIV